MRNVVSKMLQDFIVKQKINYNTIFKDQYLIKYFEACYLELEDENIDQIGEKAYSCKFYSVLYESKILT